MQSIAAQREYIADYVKTHSTQVVGEKILLEHFGVPFQLVDDPIGPVTFEINHVPMGVWETDEYIKSFVEGLDTAAVIDLYARIAI